MNHRHLAYVIAVAEEKSFTKAALRCHIEQGPMSKAIQKIEDELGFALFQRNTRNVLLTPAGQVFLESARGALALLAKGSALAKLASEGMVGTLTIAHLGSTGYVILPELIRTFHASHPAIELKIRTLNSTQQLPEIESGSIDIGLCRAAPHSEKFAKTKIYSEEFLCAVHEQHPLGGRAAVSVTELKNERFVMFPRDAGPGLSEQTRAICLDGGFVPQVVQEANQLESMVGLVSARLGIALVPASMRRLTIPGLSLIPLTDCKARAEVWLVWYGESPAPQILAFVENARRCFLAPMETQV